jgi:uncharacterized protein YecE (DUF72 family)
MAYCVGCSGWSYNHWKDAFYPHGLRQKDWFQHYASVFDTVEINNSFYRTPTDGTFQAWRQQAPPDFTYAVKVNRSITQFYKLGPNSHQLFEEFIRRASLLGPALGPLLLQLPPSLGRDDDRLEAFLQLPGRTDHRLAIEFRKADWFVDEVYAILRRHGVAVAISDLEDLPVAQVATTDWTYARFHGAGGKYEGSYSDEQLSQWAERLRAIAPEGYVYFNNDARAAAPHDALRMREMLNR